MNQALCFKLNLRFAMIEKNKKLHKTFDPSVIEIFY
jgi:hypothetical protein